MNFYYDVLFQSVTPNLDTVIDNFDPPTHTPPTMIEKVKTYPNFNRCYFKNFTRVLFSKD